MAKKYYWLKLKADFFTSRAMKKLRRIAGGDTYTIIYLKLQLLSLKDEGVLYYEGIEPTFYEEMALALDEDADNVQATLVFLDKMGLISQKSENEYLLSEVPYLIGGESESAERVRRFRKKNILEIPLTNEAKALHCNAEVTESNGQVTKSNTEIDIDIDKEIDIDIEKEKRESKKTPAPKETKHTYGEYKHVKLTDTDLTKLNSDYGEEMTKQLITFLDEYIEMKGYKAKNHYLAIKKWVVDAVKERERKSYKPNTKAQELNDFYDVASRWAGSEGGNV